jgi:N-acetylneuraminic acid mutarotase
VADERNRVLMIGLLSAALALGIPACTSEPGPTEPVAADNAVPAALSSALASNTWTAKAPHNFSPLYNRSAGVVTNAAGRSMVYVFGGTDGQGGTGFGTSTYNVATNTWSGKADSRVYVERSNGVGTIGSKLYFSGGYDRSSGEPWPSRNLWAYDPAANRMIRKADMPKATAQGVTGVIDGKLYVLPGTCADFQSCEQEPIRQLFRYDPATNKWVGRAPSPHFHRHGAAGVINGKLYVAGGFHGFQPVAYLDVYDPATNRWKTLAPIPRAGHAIGAAMDGKLFVISWPNAYVYNAVTNKWRTIAAPAHAHQGLVRVLLNGHAHLLAVGGYHGPNGDIPSDSELYTP